MTCWLASTLSSSLLNDGEAPMASTKGTELRCDRESDRKPGHMAGIPQRPSRPPASSPPDRDSGIDASRLLG